MKFKDEFQRSDLAKALIEAIHAIKIDHPVNIMEVCGTHTHAIARFGICSMMPENVTLLSGPGCPVCVTPNEYIDRAIALSGLHDVIIASFGDMFRVPGSYSSLQAEKSKGADIRLVYSPLDALGLAKENPDKKVVFLGVGFETTAPTIAATILQAKEEGVTNFFVLAGFKTLPEALRTLAESPEVNIQGLLAPGHLSVVTGTKMYEEMCEKYGIPAVVTGFEALDILDGIRELLRMISEGRSAVKIAYSRVVRPEGNAKAMHMLDQVFEPVDSRWRGLGVIPRSGLQIREEYAAFDASRALPVEVPKAVYAKDCICGLVLTGTRTPMDCPNYGTYCTPGNPLGACMVSSEGTCAAYYRYQPLPAKLAESRQ